ncbi:MAG: hypothetical protein K2N43_07210, partial [Lachnospiraceae bacterium]|nr:hypothetical protein [Lachnospiraceae bacterium]
MREMWTKGRKKENRSRMIAGVFAFLFAVALLFGSRLDSVENVDVKDWRLWVSVLVLTIIFSGLVQLLWRLLDMLQAKGGSGKKVTSDKITNVLEWADQHVVLISFLFLLLCWIPVFLAVYPGFFVYDAQDEYVQ